MLFQPQRHRHLVDRPDRPDRLKQLPARGRKEKDVIHEADIEQASARRPLVQFLQEECTHRRAERAAERDAEFNRAWRTHSGALGDIFDHFPEGIGGKNG